MTPVNHSSPARVFTGALHIVATLFAVMVAWHFSSWMGLAIPFVWGSTISVLMRYGIDSAPPEAWEEPEVQALTLKVKLVFLSILFVPAIYPLLLADVFAGMAWAWISLTGFRLADVVYTRIRGELVKRSKLRKDSDILS